MNKILINRDILIEIISDAYMRGLNEEKGSLFRRRPKVSEKASKEKADEMLGAYGYPAMEPGKKLVVFDPQGLTIKSDKGVVTVYGIIL